jgi:hypothetical protein
MVLRAAVLVPGGRTAQMALDQTARLAEEAAARTVPVQQAELAVVQRAPMRPDPVELAVAQWAPMRPGLVELAVAQRPQELLRMGRMVQPERVVAQAPRVRMAPQAVHLARLRQSAARQVPVPPRRRPPVPGLLMRRQGPLDRP